MFAIFFSFFGVLALMMIIGGSMGMSAEKEAIATALLETHDVVFINKGDLTLKILKSNVLDENLVKGRKYSTEEVVSLLKEYRIAIVTKIKINTFEYLTTDERSGMLRKAERRRDDPFM